MRHLTYQSHTRDHPRFLARGFANGRIIEGSRVSGTSLDWPRHDVEASQIVRETGQNVVLLLSIVSTNSNEEDFARVLIVRIALIGINRSVANVR